MIKDKYPEIIIQYHGHSGPGLSMASILEVCNNGADIIDTAIEHCHGVRFIQTLSLLSAC